MDAKRLSKMTVSKLREEAEKFEDLKGVHGMDKPLLLKVLKEKYGIIEEHHNSKSLVERKHALKEKIRQLKTEQKQALMAKELEKSALLRKRLHNHRRILRKIVKQEAEAEA